MKSAVEDGIVVPEVQPTSPGWVTEWTKVVCPLVFCYVWRGDTHALFVRGSQRMYASSGGVGHLHFLQKKGAERAGRPYHFLDMGGSPTEGYRNLLSGWDNKAEGYFEDTEEVYETELS
jgi:hypothetical protein